MLLASQELLSLGALIICKATTKAGRGVMVGDVGDVGVEGLGGGSGSVDKQAPAARIFACM